jgi:hypothetical protein
LKPEKQGNQQQFQLAATVENMTINCRKHMHLFADTSELNMESRIVELVLELNVQKSAQD